jgi:hypothetical protein
MYLRGQAADPEFAEQLPRLARAEFLRAGTDALDKLILLWVLGLTNKQVQNVLRSDAKAWDEYVAMFTETVDRASTDATKTYGALSGNIKTTQNAAAVVTWKWTAHLLAAVGSQTLGI